MYLCKKLIAMENSKVAMTFKDKVGKPFTVYVVFEDMCGLLREYTCLITPYTIFGMWLPNAYRIKLYHYDEGSKFYFELHNKVHYEYTSCLERSVLRFKGDGSDVRYSHGSSKSVFLDKKRAIEEAKSDNAAVKNDVRHAEDELQRFQIKEREGSINVEINGIPYIIYLGKESFVAEGVPGTFSYDDCKAANGVVVEYRMIEQIKKRLEEHESDKL
jgi:hypothetical protein